MKLRPLKDFADVIMGQSPPSTSYNFEGDGLPFFQGKAEFESTYPRVKKWCNSPTKLAEQGDVLLSVRAPVGPTNVCPEKSCIGRGLAAIRPKKNKSDTFFLLYYLRFIENQLANRGKGSTFASINREDVETIKIPDVDYDNQRFIVKLLSKAEFIIEKRRQTLRLADEFLKSAFLEMFGDPVNNSKNLKLVKFETLGKIERGKSKHRPRNAPELLGGPYPLIQTGNVANSSGYIKSYTQTYSEVGLKQSRMWPSGTLCITIAANIGKTGIMTFDACFPDSVVGFTPNEKTCVEYVQYWMSFLQKGLEQSAPESAQKNINLAILRRLNVPLPSTEKQQKFADLVQKVEKYKEKLKQSEAQMQNLFNSFMQRAFKGELIS